MPVRAVPGLHVDLYYLGIDRQNVTFDTATGAEIASDVGDAPLGQDRSVGLRHGGRFSIRRIWISRHPGVELASNTGYTLQQVWGQPRLGLQADTTSGGGASGPLKSFDPLFPKNAYFTEASINWPINFIDVFPSVTIQPTFNFAVTAG